MVAGCHIKPEQFFNLIFGYNAQYLENIAKTATGTTIDILSSAVPAGEVWVITSVGAWDTSRQATYAEIGIMDGGATKRNLYPIGPIGTSWVLGARTELVLKATDTVTIRLGGTVNNDVCGANFHGYKMKVAQ